MINTVFEVAPGFFFTGGKNELVVRLEINGRNCGEMGTVQAMEEIDAAIQANPMIDVNLSIISTQWVDREFDDDADACGAFCKLANLRDFLADNDPNRSRVEELRAQVFLKFRKLVEGPKFRP